MSFESKAEEPPPFPLTDLDRILLNQNDEDYQAHNWEELKQIIGTSY